MNASGRFQYNMKKGGAARDAKVCGYVAGAKNRHGRERVEVDDIEREFPDNLTLVDWVNEAWLGKVECTQTWTPVNITTS